MSNPVPSQIFDIYVDSGGGALIPPTRSDPIRSDTIRSDPRCPNPPLPKWARGVARALAMSEAGQACASRLHSCIVGVFQVVCEHPTPLASLSVE